MTALQLPAADALPVAGASDVEKLLLAGAVCAIGVSGGKDSQACALAVAAHLDRIGHTGPRVLVHSDLGRVEWKDSLPVCEKLARHLGWELMTVRRRAGDMLARWQGRWAANVERYRTLSCVRLILPWSTPSMRFCTSELKPDVICRALKQRFPEQPIVNVTGIRREESPSRSRMPVWQLQPKLARRGLAGVTWNAIIEWSIADVFQSIAASGLALHEAYTRYNASRVSCAFCIMSAEADLRAAAGCEDNVPLYVQMVELEAESTFAFQGNRWLADVAPRLLPAHLAVRVEAARRNAVRRQAAEARLPKHLLYTAGWPTSLPSMEEAGLIAEVRREVAAAVSLAIGYTSATEVRERYAQLLAEKPTDSGQEPIHVIGVAA